MSSLRARPPIIRIANGTFYRHHPHVHSSHPNPVLFQNLSWELPSTSDSPRNWCIIGPSLSGKTTLLQILRGQHLCLPPTARTYPFLSTDAVPHRLRSAHRAIQYVGFDGERMGQGLGAGTTSAYLSARYEARREITDFSLRDFLLGNTQLNPLQDPTAENAVSQVLLDRVVHDLRLEALLDLPVAFLSNGQGRRARIARSLLLRPEVLLLDEPFMGLDPTTVTTLSPILGSLAEKASPRLVLSARPQDPLPDWITHLIYLRNDCQVEAIGSRESVLKGLANSSQGAWAGISKESRTPSDSVVQANHDGDATAKTSMGSIDASDPCNSNTSSAQDVGEALVEMNGCQVRYGTKVVLGNWSEQTNSGTKDGLFWTVRRGERWGIFGPNGSGKTTIVSLLCSDHPQTYSLPIKLFGQSRLPERGSIPLTFWDIQSRIGHSSPEVHQHMPKGLTIRKVVENAWADTFQSVARLDKTSRAIVDAALRWFAPELDPVSHTAQESHQDVDDLRWADDYFFGELSFSAQRIALFLRAVIKSPDIVVLDEAFSGMDDAVRDKCMRFLSQGTQTPSEEAPTYKGLSERQALICISHVKEEVPDCVREWLCLPEANSRTPARFGQLSQPLRHSEQGWREIWSMQ